MYDTEDEKFRNKCISVWSLKSLTYRIMYVQGEKEICEKKLKWGLIFKISFLHFWVGIGNKPNVARRPENGKWDFKD